MCECPLLMKFVVLTLIVLTLHLLCNLSMSVVIALLIRLVLWVVAVIWRWVRTWFRLLMILVVTPALLTLTLIARFTLIIQVRCSCACLVTVVY